MASGSRARRAPAVAVFFLVDAALAVTSGTCTKEPLQVLGPGRYIRIGATDGELTTCAEITRGACPYAVQFLGLPCLVNCIESEADCVLFNKHTPGVNPFVDPQVCAPCSITACEACEHHGGDLPPTCKRCFSNFVGVGAEDGRWTECVIWDQNSIYVVAIAFGMILFLITLMLIVTTAVGGGCCNTASEVGGKMVGGLSTSKSVPSQEPREPLIPEQADLRACNAEAIQTGLVFSLRASIKFSALATLFRKSKTRGNVFVGMIRMLCDHSSLQDMGIGLQLFFNVQVFLIAVASVVWAVGHTQFVSADPDHAKHSALLEQVAAGQCPTHPMDLMGELVALSPKLGVAAHNRIVCVLLWVVLVLMSLCFHYYQAWFMGSYDRHLHSAEDYTLQLTNVPENFTSERRLKRLLEEELRMHEKIHGVCICYNFLSLPEHDKEEIEEMLENMTEHDTWKNGWCPENQCIGGLKQRIEHDKQKFTEFVRSGRLKCSGQAWVVFKRQVDMVKVQEERCGIRRAIFEAETEEQMNDLIHGSRYHSHSSEGEKQPGARTRQGNSMDSGSGGDGFIEIAASCSEPGGVRFEAFTEDPGRHRMNVNVWMPLRMVGYIVIYAISAQVFYSSMIKPWQDNFIAGVESSLAVGIAGKLVIGLNFAIQTIVMIDVERWGNFKSFSEVDERTFLWNTLLLVITNAYIIMQECYRGGIRWVLAAPTEVREEQLWEWQRIWYQSSVVEEEIGKSLASVMMEQIMMLYVIGEVANVLAPVICYWIALRSIYVWQIGGEKSHVQKLLRKILPKQRSDNGKTIGAREAERAQILMPLLLWMEYTYVVVFAWMALFTFFLATKEGNDVCGLLLFFSILFYIWQRCVMLWLYGKATYDTNDTYLAFIRVWGCVLGTLPPQAVWWGYRLGEIKEPRFMVVVMVLVFVLASLVFQYGIIFVNWKMGHRFGSEGVDDFGAKGDPGYHDVVEKVSASWWNVNPIYVLKTRYCPEEPGYQVHSEALQKNLWPTSQPLRGFFEPGKEFRHEKKSVWEQKHNVGPQSSGGSPR